MRAALYEAALVLLTSSRGRWSWLKVWGLAAVTLAGGLSVFKPVGARLLGSLGRLRQFETISGGGSSMAIATEDMVAWRPAADGFRPTRSGRAV